MKYKHILFFAIALVSNSTFQPHIHTNKNFLMPRPAGRDLYMDHSIWYQNKRDADNISPTRFGCAIQMCSFFKHSTKKTKLGTYFGAKNTNDLTFGPSYEINQIVPSNFIIHDALKDEFTFKLGTLDFVYHKPTKTAPSTLPTGILTQLSSYDLALGYVSAIPGTTGLNLTQAQNIITTLGQDALRSTAAQEYRKFHLANSAKGLLTINPKRIEQGLKISVYTGMQNKYYCKIDVPIVKVKHDLGLTLVSERRHYETNEQKNVSLISMLQGLDSEKDTDDKDQQLALHYLKLPYQSTKEDKPDYDKKVTKTGVGDIDITLGARLADAQDYDMGCYVRLTAPVSSKVEAEYLFEPVTGGGRHSEIAIGFESSADIKKFPLIQAEFYTNAYVGYAFANTEKRTLSAFLDRSIVMPWQQYFLVATIDEAGAMQPMANITTIHAKVKPGFRAEGLFGIGLRKNNYLVDLGISFAARQGETLSVDTWDQDGKFGIPHPIIYRTDMKFDPNNLAPNELNNSSITKDELDFSSAATPSSLTSIFFASAGYYNTEAMPFSASIGCAYETSKDNCALSYWSVWAKLACAF